MGAILKVMFLAAEADPFVKVGGLGDVAGSLPLALHRLSTPELTLDIRLVIPYHGAIQRQAYPLRKLTSFPIQQAEGPLEAVVLSGSLQGLPVLFIDGPSIPPDASVYSSDALADGLKFTFFSLAALEMIPQVGWIPDVIHANDWHTSPAIYALKRSRAQDPLYRRIAALLGVHNLPYMGIGAGQALWAFGLPPAADERLPKWARHVPLALGLSSADHIVAPSPTYAREILTPEFGSGLDGFLQQRQEVISGILNGIDTAVWDPAGDPQLAQPFSIDSLPARRENKLALQRELGLAEDPGTPLIAMVTRMDHQKGIDLVPPSLRDLKGQPWQAVILGTGDTAIESAVRRLEKDFPERVRAVIRFDNPLSHRIYAGADMLVIPSRYEPSGLTQMIAMRYGCIPVARSTGGLRDSIQDYSPDQTGTGFLFSQATARALKTALERALGVYSQPSIWQSMQYNSMLMDFSWQVSARKYLQLYQSMIKSANL